MKSKPTKKYKSPLEQLNNLRQQLKEQLVDRDEVIDGMLVALLAREHILLLGHPGTAKTLLAQLVASAIEEVSYFYWLLTKFSTPEELFGPYSIKALKEDRLTRIIKNKLPTASIAFLDEIWKANSSILNSLLTLVNERVYHNGDEVVDCPLATLVGASNELPEKGELAALYDRFLLRFWVDYIKDKAAFAEMLKAGEPIIVCKIPVEDLQELQHLVGTVAITEELADRLVELKMELEKINIVNSDRRWVKCLKILQAYAVLNGHPQVEETDLLILQHVLWIEPKDKAEVTRIVAKVANPVIFETQQILDALKGQYRNNKVGDNVSSGEETAVFTRIVDLNSELKRGISKLERLGDHEVVASAVAEVTEMVNQAARYAAKVSGLG